MTKQWHNTRVPQKPFSRYNPSLKQKVGSGYRPWFVIVALLCIFIGIGIVGCSAALKSYDSDIKDEIFQLWVGIPLIFAGIMALVPCATRSKNTVILFLVIVLVVMVVCATGSIIIGLRYWMDEWRQTKQAFDDDKCVDQLSSCACTGVINSPVKNVDCDDLEIMVNLVISLIALGAGGFLAALAGVYLGFMAMCCAPWMYIEWYEEQYDPDFGGKKEVVRPTGGSVNAAYGNYK